MMRNGGNYLNRGSGAAARFGQKKESCRKFLANFDSTF